MRVIAGTGVSRQQEADAAGREAATQALEQLHGQPPALVIVYTTIRYDRPALLAGIRSVTGDALLVGATTSGEFAAGEHLGYGEGVAVLCLTAGHYRFAAASAAHVRGHLTDAGQRIARDAKAAAGASPHAAVFVLADSLLGDLQQLMQGVYRITGPKVALCGGAAGDEMQFKASFVFHNDEVIEEGAVALWIASDHPMHVVMRHGWQPLGMPLLVTRAEGIEILELGGRPALPVYEAELGKPLATVSPEEFWATSIHYPFGILQTDGSTVIRMARRKTERGSLLIQGCVPPSGSAVQVMTGSADGLMNVAEEVVSGALAGVPDPAVVLVFSCAARAAIYGARRGEEPARVQAAAGEIPTFGFFCCGEFARTAGVLSTHNATLTGIAL
jgi:hypothetical protein